MLQSSRVGCHCTGKRRGACGGCRIGCKAIAQASSHSMGPNACVRCDCRCQAGSVFLAGWLKYEVTGVSNPPTCGFNMGNLKAPFGCKPQVRASLQRKEVKFTAFVRDGGVSTVKMTSFANGQGSRAATQRATWIIARRALHGFGSQRVHNASGLRLAQGKRDAYPQNGERDRERRRHIGPRHGEGNRGEAEA